MNTENEKPLKGLNTPPTPAATSMTPTRPCVPEDHKCNPTECIPLSVAEAQLETVCVPDICDPAVKCAPQRDAAQVSTCVPDMNCDPGDIWSCAPATKSAAKNGGTQLGPCVPGSSDCGPYDICTPNPNCNPSSRAMDAGPVICVPTACGPDIPCTPEARGRAASCDPGKCTPDFWGCSPIHRAPRSNVMADFLWLDLTRKCQLKCGHCYNNSGPDGGHGSMIREDWLNVIDQAAAGGVRMIQLIGGEPTMHPNFAELLCHALAASLRVEIYTNLVRVKDEWWELFQRPGVSLATSYYSDDPAEHNAVTERDSHRKTRANIERATELGIPLRAGVVTMRENQNTASTSSDLVSLGVAPHLIGFDHVRAFGRAEQDHNACDFGELCGNCGNGRASIGPDGSVAMCIMSSWLPVGNVKTAPLADILASEAMAAARAKVLVSVAAGPCDPGADCAPDAYPCQPG